MANLLLGVRTSLHKYKRIKLNNVDLDTKVASFKLDVSKRASIPKERLELVYCGNILSDDVSLRDSGIKPGVMIHVLKKKIKDTSSPTQRMSEANIQGLYLVFRTLTSTYYRTFLQNMCRPESIDNITPGLRQDPVAIAMIQDPELIDRIDDIESVRRIVEMHPALAEAANYILGIAHEEAKLNNINVDGNSTGMLQATFSDDDDMESSQSSSESRANNDFTEQMRELGLTDAVVNFQALQVAGGNVHAAIDLVFSGAISSEHQ